MLLYRIHDVHNTIYTHNVWDKGKVLRVSCLYLNTLLYLCNINIDYTASSNL